MEAGFKYRLQCLPRILTLFCEFGTEQLARRGRQQPVRERSAATTVRACACAGLRDCMHACVRVCDASHATPHALRTCM